MKRLDRGKHHRDSRAEYLLVDGYNIINSWPELRVLAEESLEDARERLIHILADYQGYRGIRIILVFDAHMTDSGIGHFEDHDGLEVIYTKKHETADHYIERWVNQFGNDGNVWVATSDFLEQTIIMSRGGIRISARELEEEIYKSMAQRNRDYIGIPQKDSGSLGDRINPDILGKLETWRRQS